MEHIMMLDCTLRDGGYLVDKYFGEENIYGIINGLVDCGVEIVEVGFLQNEGFGEGKTVFLNSKEAKKYVPHNKQKSIFTLFADCGRYDVSNLNVRENGGIDAIRECFFKTEVGKAIDNCKKIQSKGYLCFVQPVDILGYSDFEILNLISKVNEIEPYCFSIVDTFGSMYEKDLIRLYELIDHNLSSKCKIGFHSHNNLQLSSALSQSMIALSAGRRDIVIDGTISGMGRGAGNTPIELIIQYLNEEKGYKYNIDALLDVIDHQIRNLRSRAEWGYNTYFFIAGAQSAHVNNIAYLRRKNSIQSKDIRYILSELDSSERKRYNYDLLEQKYLKYMDANIDDHMEIDGLRKKFEGRNIVILAAGKSINDEKEKIIKYIEKNEAIVISINYPHKQLPCDYLYCSNLKRYKDYVNTCTNIPIICTSNIPVERDRSNIHTISFTRLFKGGWDNADNSTIMLLRLLSTLNVSKIGIAGFDGYSVGENYAEKIREYNITREEIEIINTDMREMFYDFLKYKNPDLLVELITNSDIFHGGNL